MRGRLTSSHFVGRLGELAELELAARDAADGRPAVVLLGGESGVGKTRLVAELERHLGQFLVLRGEGVEQGESELPYAPLLGALRPLVRENHPALTELSAGSRAQLATLIPSLGEASLPRAGDEAGQVRLFEALLELFDLLSASQPTVLILEDVHWADRSTRTFVAFLTRSMRHERLLVLLTYRSDELHRRHALRPLLAELDRLERTRRIDLVPLDRAELAEVLTDILGEAPSEQVIERVFTRSQGNPLYIEELLAAGLDGLGSAPQSLRDAFMLRIEQLSEPAQLVARTVAVGRLLDDVTIAEVSGLEPDELTEALRETVAGHVLVTGSDDRFLFRHELLREALYDDLLPGERGEFHLAIARSLEHRLGDDRDADVSVVTTIATHYAAAGDQTAALRATVTAALAAERIFAYGEVAQAAERALELWPRVPDIERATRLDHVELLALAGRAHGMGADRARGEVLLNRALAELEPSDDRVRYGALVAELARIQWSLNKGREALDTAQRALELLDGDEAREERVPLLAWLARTRVLRGRYRDALTDGELALQAAVAIGDATTEGEVLNTLGMARMALGDIEGGVASLRQALAIAHSEGDLDSASTAYGNLAESLAMAGRTADAIQTAKEGLAETPRRLGRFHDWMSLTVTGLALDAGDWATARAQRAGTTERLDGRTLIFRELIDAELALGEGANELAEQHLEIVVPLVRVSSEPSWHGTYGALLSELRRRQGDLDAARAGVAQALDELETCTDDVSRIARVTAAGVAVEADQAQRARDLREPKAERDALSRARIYMQTLRAAAQTGGPVERAWREVGAAELARARGRNDPALWAKAGAAWGALERPYAEAIALYREAEAHVERGDRAPATRAAARALELAQPLGARWLEGETRALADRARLSFEIVECNGDEPPQREDEPFGLTSRERQVLTLLAQGATNRQIGKALYMAEKTASVHVSRILAKLGVHSRTQAAAVAHRMHLS